MPEILDDRYCSVFKARSQHNLAKGERSSEGGEGLKGSQECAGESLTAGWALNCSICPRPWCEYSHHSQFQTTSQVMTSSQNQSFHSWLSTASMSLPECPWMRPTSRVKQGRASAASRGLHTPGPQQCGQAQGTSAEIRLKLPSHAATLSPSLSPPARSCLVSPGDTSLTNHLRSHPQLRVSLWGTR